MDRQRHLRLQVGLASAALLVAAAVQPSAAAEPGDFSYAQGWRIGQHPRELADVNGDGRADAVGFGDAGVLVGYGLDHGAFSPATLKASAFGRDQGWRVDRHERTLADLNADGRADVVGFGEDGLHLSYSAPNGVITTPSHPEPDLADYGVAQGWRVDRHPRELADVNGDGRADVVGFGDAGTWVSVAHHQDDFLVELRSPVLGVGDFGHDQGWRVDRHPRELADVNGDGRADVVGFGDAGTWVSYARPDGTFSAAALKVRDFGHDQGWRTDRHPRQLADVDGDGRADVVGFGDAGTWVSYARPDGTFSAAALKVRDFGHDQGWRVDRHPRFVERATSGQGADVVGFGDGGTYFSFSGPGETLSAAWLGFEEFGHHQGWRADRHPRELADVSGDGIPDVVGFGERQPVVATLLIHAVPPDIFEHDPATGG
ncbi:VCBS repeat-containing protein [Kocuria sp. CPCC 205258]|uniref:FG-GAP repeat domain-containing protein n=1 Tax=Kocuria sp. CPCC 205258 TaxID=3073552 RepID=UPI0034D66FAE